MTPPDDFTIELPADRMIEARRLGVDPASLFEVGRTGRSVLERFYADRRDPPPSEHAIPNAIAADLVLIGVKIGRGEVPDVLLERGE